MLPGSGRNIKEILGIIDVKVELQYQGNARFYIYIRLFAIIMSILSWNIKEMPGRPSFILAFPTFRFNDLGFKLLVLLIY